MIETVAGEIAEFCCVASIGGGLGMELVWYGSDWKETYSAKALYIFLWRSRAACLRSRRCRGIFLLIYL